MSRCSSQRDVRWAWEEGMPLCSCLFDLLLVGVYRSSVREANPSNTSPRPKVYIDSHPRRLTG